MERFFNRRYKEEVVRRRRREEGRVEVARGRRSVYKADLGLGLGPGLVWWSPSMRSLYFASICLSLSPSRSSSSLSPCPGNHKIHSNSAWTAGHQPANPSCVDQTPVYITQRECFGSSSSSSRQDLPKRGRDLEQRSRELGTSASKGSL